MLTTAVQEALLVLLCYGDKAHASMARALVPASHYDAFYKDIAAAASDYLDKYEQTPSEHTVDLVQTLSARDPDSEEIYERLLYSMQTVRDSIQPEFVLDQAKLFARHQRMLSGVSSALEVLDEEREDQLESRVNAAEAALRNVFTETTDMFDPGIVSRDRASLLSFLTQEEEEVFDTGVAALDRFYCGPARKQLHIFAAPSGRGKSWYLINLLKTSVLHRRRVLYITLEMSERQVAGRVLQSFFSISKRQVAIDRAHLGTDKRGQLVSIDVGKMKKRPSFQDKDIIRFVADRVKSGVMRTPFVIKQFPTGELTLPMLEAYMDMLASTHAFQPDLVLVDYTDLMQVSSSNYRIELGVMIERLRGLAVRRNLAVATASQLNREAMTAKTATAKNLAEDIKKLNTADSLIVYNQTRAEHALGLARLYLHKSRNDVDNLWVAVSQAYATGQFCLSSALMADTYWPEVEALTGDDEDADDD